MGRSVVGAYANRKCVRNILLPYSLRREEMGGCLSKDEEEKKQQSPKNANSRSSEKAPLLNSNNNSKRPSEIGSEGNDQAAAIDSKRLL